MSIYNSFKSLVMPPRFQDVEQNRIAGILYASSIAILVGFCTLLLYRVMSGQPRLTLPLLTVVSIVFVSVYLVRRGIIAWSASVLSWTVLSFLIYMLVLYDGIHDTALIAFPGILVLTSLVLRRRYFFEFTVVTLLSISVIGYLEINGVIHNSYSGKTNYTDILDVIVILGITALTVRLLADNLLNSLALSRENEKASRESERNYRDDLPPNDVPMIS